MVDDNGKYVVLLKKDGSGNWCDLARDLQQRRAAARRGQEVRRVSDPPIT